MRPTVHATLPSVEGGLSHAERLIWATERAASELPFLECPRHLALAVRVSGPLDVLALRRSIDDIARRHAVLRSRLVERDGTVTRAISPDAGSLLTITSIDDSPDTGNEAAPQAARKNPVGSASLAQRLFAPLRGADHAADRRQRDLEEDLVREEVNAPFAPGGSLLRARLLTFGAARAALVVTVHHLVADGWSLRILARELEAGYASYANGQAPSLPPLPAQYADYVAWQHGRLTGPAAAQLAAAWREQFAGAPEVRIPGDLGAGERASTRAAQHTFEIAADHIERLRRLAAAHRTTVGVAALSSFIALVADVSGQWDVVVGVPVWDRGRPAFEELIGLFMNVVPVRVTMPASDTGLALLMATRDQFRTAMRSASLPYPWLREREIADGEPAPVRFRLVFNFAAIDGITLALPATVCERIDVFADTPACADLSLHIFQRAHGCAGLFIYKADRYSPAFVASLAGRFVTLVAEAGT